MKKWQLRIRKSDISIFQNLLLGKKTIETRAATPRYKKVSKGDILVMNCDGREQEFMVEKVEHYPSVQSLFENVDFRKIFPDSSSLNEAASAYNSFSGYADKINQFGLFAFHIKGAP